MEQTRNYVDILVSSLERKLDVLVKLEKLEAREEEIFSNDKVSVDDVKNFVDRRDEYLNKLIQLDTGFEKLFERVKVDITENKEMYREQIIHMQELIKQISSKSVSIQAEEARHKENYHCLFDKKKQDIVEFKKSNKTVSNYYKNTYDAHQEGSSYFLDKRQ